MSSYSSKSLIGKYNSSKTAPEKSAGMADAGGMGLGMTLSLRLLNQIQTMSHDL